MKRNYQKPMMLAKYKEYGFVPIVAAVASALGVSQAVAGLGLGAAAGLGGVAAGTAISKAAGQSDSTSINVWQKTPSLERVEENA